MDANFDPWIKLSNILLLLSILSPLCLEADKITLNQSISGDHSIVSGPTAIFELGFFTPPVNSSIIWSTKLNSTTKFKSIEAELEDSGNFVLKNGTKILWQSFDHPTDTWLPGGKLIFNKKTHQPQRLTSWKNADDPAPGLFNLQLDPDNKQYVIMWNQTRQYWTSGPWNSQEQIFSLVPEMRLNYIYNFSYIDNDDESYFTYSVYHSSFISRFVMDTSGQVKQFTWLDNTQEWNLFWSNPKQQCEVYAFCGDFGTCNQNSYPSCNCLHGFSPKLPNDWNINDYTSGCVRRTQLECENPTNKKKNDRFYVYSNVVLPQNAQSSNAANIEECQLNCLINCSCNAYSYDSSGCSFWSEGLLNMQQLSDGDTNGKTLYLKLSATEFPNKSNKKLVIGIVMGSVILIIALLGLVFLFWKKRTRTTGPTTSVEGSLISFSYKDLQSATKNFSNKLGGGGFGSVFKGTLPDSSLIAVKKLESFSQGEKQFRTEVSTIGTVQHVNLVRLRGFCSVGTNKLLVYDYMPNGSLDFHLFPDDSSKLLDWRKRYQIALGTARGLAYLHEKCRDCIIHCDIKPENILLDGEFCPKVADFGLAKLMGRDFSRVLTTMRGTRGYLAPEWISGVAITAKADVFSYGMMLFELISGHRNTEKADGIVKFFPTWAASKVAEAAEIMSILDPRLEGNADEQEVMKICKLACWCIQDNENHRPSMGQVVQILEGVLDVNMPPMPRSLQVFVEGQDSILFYTESSSAQSSQTQNPSSNTSSITKTSSSIVSNTSLA